MLIDKYEERPFVTLGTSQSIATTSLDKYIQQRKQIKPTPLLPPESPIDNPKETIAKLQKEQSVLCEELNAERRRNENLSATFKRAQTLSTSQFIEKLNNITKILQGADKENKAVNETLSMISQIIDEESKFEPGTLRAAANTQTLSPSKEKEQKYLKENERIEKEIARLQNEKDELQKKLEEINAETEKTQASKKDLVEKLKYYYETFKKRDAAWKEKAKKMQEQIGIAPKADE